MFDVIVVGAGPAGLNAALTLGRARRQVLLVAGGRGRGASSPRIHGLLPHEGTPSEELRRRAFSELTGYVSVQIKQRHAAQAKSMSGRFAVTFADGTQEMGRRLLLATGVEDVLPSIPGLADRWGRGVVHCPYQHGWERQNLPIAALETGGLGVSLALHLRRFSDDVVLCTNRDHPPTSDQARLLAAWRIPVINERISRLEGAHGSIQRIVFSDGAVLPRSVVFVRPPTRQRSDLPAQLGCGFRGDGSVQVNDLGQTTQPGVFAAGDMARRTTASLSSGHLPLAAADGVTTAITIDQQLLYAD
ncbi:NAD(P)/FAD-dependent oxidoreductase [Spirillospora sp. CA-142024]|uniref:NAD(P)/FAD-dependent oxidoreductase n=1 Tax=Spirillospora sp. CA-142024 TaxID=3240036 RepID=UPI003D90440F